MKTEPMMVVIECPTCGAKSRASVLAAAYRGGWCIGPMGQRHKARNYKIIEGSE